MDGKTAISTQHAFAQRMLLLSTNPHMCEFRVNKAKYYHLKSKLCVNRF